MNNCTFVGRISSDIDLKFLPGTGKAVAKFNLAVDRTFKTENGPKADFFQVQIWGKPAENVANFLHKGSQCAVRGEMQNNNYDKEGKKVYGMLLNAQEVQFLDSKSKGAEQSQAEPFADDMSGFTEMENDSEIPF